MKIEKRKFAKCYDDWKVFQHLLNVEMDRVANFPEKEGEDLFGQYQRRIKQNNNQYCLFLTIKNIYVGMVTYAEYDDYIYICDFYILEKYRNNGYGRRLFNEVLKERNGKRVHLSTVGGNERVLRFYKRCGFRISGYNLQLK